MSFKEGYVTAPQCAPSRAGLLTGRYQEKFGFEYNLDTREPFTEHAGCLPLGERTMADYLHACGYHTGMVGKWHLGLEPQFHPLQRGFDEFFGFLNGGSFYLPPGKAKCIPGIMRNKTPVQVTSYLTEVFGDEANSYIERNKEKPWFLYLAFNAPHEPWEAPQKYLDRFPGVEGQQARTYAAMVSALDDAVGGVLQTLEKLQLKERTVIVFLSDNGAPLHRVPSASNGPLRGEKGDVLEGGIRIPLIVEWPGHVPAGTQINTPVSTLDLIPTFLDIVGKPAAADAKLDGQSLLSTLTTGKEPQGDRAIYWLFRLQHPEARHSWGIRQGPWKFWRGPDSSQSDKGKLLCAKTALFNIEADIHEDKDCSAEQPETRKTLEAKLGEWMKILQPPKWGDSKGRPFPKVSE